jgi:hypothetical protein
MSAGGFSNHTGGFRGTDGPSAFSTGSSSPGTTAYRDPPPQLVQGTHLLGPGTDRHADAAVGAGLVPDSVAGQVVDGPFPDAAHDLLLPGADGARRAVLRTELALLAGLPDLQIHRPVIFEGKVGGDSGYLEAIAELAVYEDFSLIQGSEKNLTNSPEVEDCPAISPDGKLVAYLAEPVSQSGIGVDVGSNRKPPFGLG